MDAIIVCSGSAVPTLVKTSGLSTIYGVQCSDGSTPGTAAMGAVGLSGLDWSDVTLLISAVLLSACIAAGWNILYKLFYRG
jgi:hypothetical protein